DENAKYPLGWMLMNDKEVEREVEAGFEVFCEWMGLDYDQIDSLREQLAELKEIKPFEVGLKDKKVFVRKKVSSRSRRRKPRYKQSTKTVTAFEQITKQSKDFAKLTHSSLLDLELLARPIVISDSRKESALKYVGMWGTTKVNINTAPRHVLEAVFSFGGDAEAIAEKIIQKRRVQPFENIEKLRESLLEHSDSIRKCEKYIATESRFFTIKVTAQSGKAKASTVIAVMKDGDEVKQIAVLSG
ncbi:MAG: type II secretion system protein GspK, partial [Planctomycetota bacterium]